MDNIISTLVINLRKNKSLSLFKLQTNLLKYSNTALSCLSVISYGNVTGAYYRRCYQVGRGISFFDFNTGYFY